MNDIVDKIANGTAQLLGVEDIVSRLGVSRSTFDRWVKNGAPGATMGSMIRDIRNSDDRVFQSEKTSLAEKLIAFPPADIRIGGSPKWEMETFKTWLRANVKAG